MSALINPHISLPFRNAPRVAYLLRDDFGQCESDIDCLRSCASRVFAPGVKHVGGPVYVPYPQTIACPEYLNDFHYRTPKVFLDRHWLHLNSEYDVLVCPADAEDISCSLDLFSGPVIVRCLGLDSLGPNGPAANTLQPPDLPVLYPTAAAFDSATGLRKYLCPSTLHGPCLPASVSQHSKRQYHDSPCFCWTVQKTDHFYADQRGSAFMRSSVTVGPIRAVDPSLLLSLARGGSLQASDRLLWYSLGMCGLLVCEQDADNDYYCELALAVGSPFCEYRPKGTVHRKGSLSDVKGTLQFASTILQSRDARDHLLHAQVTEHQSLVDNHALSAWRSVLHDVFGQSRADSPPTLRFEKQKTTGRIFAPEECSLLYRMPAELLSNPILVVTQDGHLAPPDFVCHDSARFASTGVAPTRVLSLCRSTESQVSMYALVFPECLFGTWANIRFTRSVECARGNDYQCVRVGFGCVDLHTEINVSDSTDASSVLAIGCFRKDTHLCVGDDHAIIFFPLSVQAQRNIRSIVLNLTQGSATDVRRIFFSLNGEHRSCLEWGFARQTVTLSVDSAAAADITIDIVIERRYPRGTTHSWPEVIHLESILLR